MMFDASQNGLVPLKQNRPAEADRLKELCLGSAALWLLRRRAKLPYLPPQRLPVAARAG